MKSASARHGGRDEVPPYSLVKAIHEASPDGILVVNDKDTVVLHNQRLFDVLGIAPEDIPGVHGGILTGLPDRLLLSRALEFVDDPEAFLQGVQALYADPHLEDHCEIAMKDGRTLERHSRALRGLTGQYRGRVCFFRDISARKRAENALQKMSQVDPLTGVANRRYFFERAGEEISRARRFRRDVSFVMLDIDGFKNINDRWGHAAGDRVLQVMCKASCVELREVDLFARIGGDEFAVLMPDTDFNGAFMLAERVRKSVATLAVTEGHDKITFTVSEGVTTLQPQDTVAADALKRADVALYEAKRAGRNCTMPGARGDGNQLMMPA